MLILEIPGIVVSAFIGFFCITWFFDRNYEDKHKAFCPRRCSLKVLVLIFGVGSLGLAVYLSVPDMKARIGSVKWPPPEFPLSSEATRVFARCLPACPSATSREPTISPGPPATTARRRSPHSRRCRRWRSRRGRPGPPRSGIRPPARRGPRGRVCAAG